MGILRPLFVLLAFCSLLFSTTYILRITSTIGRRLAMLQAFVVTGGLVWFITELLSAFKAITFIGLVSLWGIVCLIILAIIKRVSGGNIKNAIFIELREIRKCLMSLPKGLLAVLICICIGLLILGMIAFVAAPNTWDSMTYHLSRVMHWEQNQSLSFYPTSISRQLHLGPLAEMIILNFQILAGNDRLAGFVQFFAMIGCLVGVSLIAQLLGGNVYAQIFASLAAVTLPMGILQSTSTQNDYVVAFWLVCFVSLTLKQLQADQPSWIPALLTGVSLGLAILTKVTVLLFGASFGLWLAIGLIGRFKVKAWKHLIILSCATLLIISPHAFRNYRLYNNPLGPMVESGDNSYSYTNDSFGIRALTSNVLRNTAMQLTFPFGNFNDGVQKAVLLLHDILGIDVNDPAITWTDTKFRVKFSTNEDLAGNPFHLLLVVVSMFLLFNHRKPPLTLFTLCLAAGFILFSWLLKWQPWHSRLHLPLFVLAMPFAGVIFSSGLRRWVLYVVVLVLCFMSLRYLFLNSTRPLIGTESILTTDRLNQYFSASPDHFNPYQQLSRIIGDMQCNDIGLMANIDDWEYPLWVMTKAYGKDIHLEHILVDNPSARLETGFAPCAIVITYPLEDQTIVYRNKVFARYRQVNQLSLFVLPAQ